MLVQSRSVSRPQNQMYPSHHPHLDARASLRVFHAETLEYEQWRNECDFRRKHAAGPAGRKPDRTPRFGNFIIVPAGNCSSTRNYLSIGGQLQLDQLRRLVLQTFGIELSCENHRPDTKTHSGRLEAVADRSNLEPQMTAAVRKVAMPIGGMN